MVRCGMPSSSQALFEAATNRANKMHAAVEDGTGRRRADPSEGNAGLADRGEEIEA
jgi:hypothetical protein